MSSSRLLIVCMILLVLQLRGTLSVSSFGGEDTALTIARAEEDLSSAYQAVKDAEGAGANISSLLSQLNEAGELLEKANMSFRAENFENATLFANTSIEIANSIKIEAYSTRDLALYQWFQRFQSALAVSILSIASIFLISLASWRFFKRHYYQKISKLRPELNSDES